MEETRAFVLEYKEGSAWLAGHNETFEKNTNLNELNRLLSKGWRVDKIAAMGGTGDAGKSLALVILHKEATRKTSFVSVGPQ